MNVGTQSTLTPARRCTRLSRQTKDHEGEDNSCQQYQAYVEPQPSLSSSAFLALVSLRVLRTHSLTKLSVIRNSPPAQGYHSSV